MLSNATRPAFPAEWSSIDISQDELSLANTLPVGQSFVWHRRPIASSSRRLDWPSPDAMTASAVKLEPTNPVELEEEPLEEWSRAIAHPNRVILLRQTTLKIYYTSVVPHHQPPAASAELQQADAAFIADYFSLDATAGVPLPELYKAWAAIDPALFGKAYSQSRMPRGVRVLRQDVWECLIAFITSSANNVPRITGLMHRISQHFTSPLLTLDDPPPPAAADGEIEALPCETAYHLYPPPSTLLDVQDGTVGVAVDLDAVLRGLGFGYRAGFIVHTISLLLKERGGELALQAGETDEAAVSRVSAAIEAFLTSLRASNADPESQADAWRAELLKFKGVGRKVADCIGLMSLDRLNAVPVDTHIQQIAARHPAFPSKLKNKATSTESVYAAVQSFLSGTWGGPADSVALGSGMAGWVQAVMFASDLKGSIAVKEEEMVKMEMVEEEVDMFAALDTTKTGRGKRVRKESITVVNSAIVHEDVDVKPGVLDLPVLGTPTRTPSRASNWTDSSPADTILMTPKTSILPDVTPTRTNRKTLFIKEEMTDVEHVNAGLAERVKRRRTSSKRA